MSAVQDVLSHVRVSDVYGALTGTAPRCTGRDKWRAAATWRGGNGLSVSGDDSRGVWHDFVSGEGGGVLDLVVRVQGGRRADALRWVADMAGMAADLTPLSPADRERWATQRRAVDRDLPAARYWRRAAVVLSEGVLDELKAGLLDSSARIQPEVGELRVWTARLGRWRRIGGAELVSEYRAWLTHDPQFTTGMVQAARRLEGAEQRAILRFLGATPAEAAA
jgi:hypothetical protein